MKRAKNVPEPKILKGLIHRGGSTWECVRCGNYFEAACHCCEPQVCGCWYEVPENYPRAPNPIRDNAIAVVLVEVTS